MWGLRRVHHNGHIAELLFTFGLVFIIERSVQMIWGMLPMAYRVPPSLDFSLFTFYGANFPAYRGFMLLVSVGMLVATWLLLKKTRVGLIIQAALTHPHMASALGHNVPRVFTIVFAGGCLLAGLAGVIGGNYQTTEPGMADAMGPIVFVVVVFGGLGSLSGCFIASILMGLIQTFAVVINYSLLRPGQAARRDLDRRQSVHGNPDRAGGPHRRAAAVRDDDHDPAVPAARPDGNARHMSGRFRRRAGSGSSALIVAIAAPWAFYNYHTGRQSGFVLSMLSQMGMMSILALSYNMLLGQAGLFSLCHATFFGIGGYATIHFLNLARRTATCRCRWSSSRCCRDCRASGSPSCSATWRPSSAPPRLR